jgi:hypothetical protein
MDKMNIDLLLMIALGIGWALSLVFFILWIRVRNLKEDSKYNQRAILEIRKELRTVNDKLKFKLEDIRKELYDIFVSVDKLLERL